MNQTSEEERENPGPQQQQEGPAQPGQPGLDHDHLRDYTALRRTTFDRKIAGVAGGIARHLNIDPVIVRVALVVLAFFGGAGIVLYAAAWLLVPEDTGKPAAVETTDRTRNALIIIALAFAALLVIGDSWGGAGFPWWLTPFALGLFLFLMVRDNRGTRSPQAYADGAPLAEPVAYTGTAYGWQPVDPTYAATAGTAKGRKRGPLLFGPTLALVLLGLGVLGLVDSAGDQAIADAAYPALALAITGVMLVVGAFYGRPGGLILMGTLSAVALAGAGLVQPSFDGDRSVTATPTTAASVLDSYDVPAGQIVLDLRDVVDVDALDGRTISLEAQAGELVVILPDDLRAEVDADVAFAGAITLPGYENGGFNTSTQQTVGSTDEGAPTIEIDAQLKLGHIEVEYSR